MAEAGERLVEENFALRQELHALKIEQQMTWSMLVGVVRKLQASSASIKVAVSSLLNHDIFWDVGNQHEFLLTIDDSANQTSDLVMLLSLAFRLLANRLEVKLEPHTLPEIITNVGINLRKRYADKEIILSMPQDGQIVWVDYDYLSLALILFGEVLLSNSANKQLALVAREEDAGWKLEIVGMDADIAQFLSVYHQSPDVTFGVEKEEILSADNVLKIMVVLKLLDLQKITMERPVSFEKNKSVVFVIPARSTFH